MANEYNYINLQFLHIIPKNRRQKSEFQCDSCRYYVNNNNKSMEVMAVIKQQ